MTIFSKPKRGKIQIIDGEWNGVARYRKIICCDCGLGHYVHHRMRKGKLEQQVFRVEKRKKRK